MQLLLSLVVSWCCILVPNWQVMPIKLPPIWTPWNEMFTWHFSFFFLSLDPFYLVIVGVKGNCCLPDHIQWQIHTRYSSSGRGVGPSERTLPDKTHYIYKRQTFMPPAGFEPAIPAGERAQAHALDCATTGNAFDSCLIVDMPVNIEFNFFFLIPSPPQPRVFICIRDFFFWPQYVVLHMCSYSARREVCLSRSVP